MRKIVFGFIFLVGLFLVQPQATAGDNSEVDSLRQDLKELRSQFNQMQQAYSQKISRMEAKIESLEAKEVTAAPVGEPTPLPGLGRPAFELPDISAIGTVVANYGNNKDDPNRNKLFLDEIELAIQGYLYPDIWANFIVALHRENDGDYDVDVEEGYIEFQTLPLIDGLSLRAGRQLIGFGKINPVHAHHWNYVDRPLVLDGYLGDHGLIGQGANFSYLMPLPFFAQLDLGAWHVDEGGHGHNGHHHGALKDETYSTRLWSSFALSSDQELEIGLSGLKSYEDHGDRAIIGGADFTYRYLGEGLRRFLYQSEFLHWTRKRSGGDVNRWGFYQHLNYRFDKYWDVGLRYDWLQEPSRTKEVNQSVSGILTRSLTETTKLRLQYQNAPRRDNHTVFLQAIFGLGPHAHPLE